jgi:hypothetical protein
MQQKSNKSKYFHIKFLHVTFNPGWRLGSICLGTVLEGSGRIKGSSWLVIVGGT